MQMIHCDMEECKAAEAVSVDNNSLGGSGLPKGWAFLEWQADGKAESNRQSKLMAKYFRAIGASLPKRPMTGDPGEEFRRVSEAVEAPADALLTLRAFLCPKCIGKLPLSGFNLVNRALLSAGLF